MKNHIPRIPKGCDQQGRHPEAAHAAWEDDDYKPAPFWWVTDVVISVCLTAAVLFLIALVGLIP